MQGIHCLEPSTSVEGSVLENLIEIGFKSFK